MGVALIVSDLVMSRNQISQVTAIVGDATVARAVRILLLGLLKPDHGSIILSDQPSHRLSQFERADKIGEFDSYQYPELCDRFSLAAHIDFSRVHGGKLDSLLEDDRARKSQALRRPQI